VRTTPSTVRRLAAATVGAAVALTGLGLGLGSAPAGAVPPGATNIISNLGYDQQGPSGQHRLDWAPDLDGTEATGYQIERWNADKSQKLFTHNEFGAVTPTVTFSGMPDEVVYQYRVRTKNVDGWGPWSGFEPIKVHTGVSYEDPFMTEEDLVIRQLIDFHGTPKGYSTWDDQIDDAADVAAFIDQLYDLGLTREHRLQVTRLYLAYFDRAPEPAGLKYWAERLDAKTSTLSSVSSFFATSQEFKTLYGGTTNQEFVKLVYENVLFREAKMHEIAYWQNRLDQGTTTRGKLMIGFSESPEGKALREGDAIVADLWATMVREPASAGIMDAYGPFIEADGTPGELGLMILRLYDYTPYGG
jgi:hypothetical protein